MKTPVRLCLAIAGISLALAGCEKKASPVPPTSSVATSAPPPPAPAPLPQVAQPPSADLDVASLQKQLGCPSAPTAKEACRVLAEFAQGSRFTGDTPSGEGRWFGFAYAVEQKKEKPDLLILAAKRVPTGQLGPNDLPIRIAMGSLPDEKRSHGMKLAAALSRSDVVGKTNQALPYVKAFAGASDRGVVPTSGASVRLISDETVYVRAAPGQKVLVIKPRSGAPAAPGDGTYAEVWLASW